MQPPAATTGAQAPAAPVSHTGRTARPALALAAVAAAYTLAQLAFVVPGSGLGWDETVYVSQVGHQAPAAYFSAPRARGISWLVAPMAAVTTSTTALRIYLALLSGAGLFAALRVWRRLLPTAVVAFAGALFAGLWLTLYYGPQAMPNLWAALACLAAVGCFLRVTRREGEIRAAAGLAAAVAVVALMRPPDAVWLVLPLAASAVVVPGWRRPALFAALPAGLLLGAAPWVAEAYTHYGGLAARLHRAGEIQGGMGWHLAVDDQVRSLVGRTLCRPCDTAWEHPWTALWWFALPLLTTGGIAAAVSAHRRSAALLATVTAASLSVPYLFLIDYAAPRFLLPAYALLAIPVAECVVFPFTRIRPAWRPVTATLLALGLAGHLAIQAAVLSRVTANNRAMRKEYTAIASELHRLGVRPPCVVSGREAPPIAYYTGCASRQPSGHDRSITAEGLQTLAKRMPVAVVVAGRTPPPGYAADWRPASLPARGLGVYLDPMPP